MSACIRKPSMRPDSGTLVCIMPAVMKFPGMECFPAVEGTITVFIKFVLDSLMKNTVIIGTVLGHAH
ncbi:MAG: hypothetical protein HW411_1021 [Gammaproteobacteria bacterium]|nr:hypothetical protein [Gammaproteobacteria bacterium]